MYLSPPPSDPFGQKVRGGTDGFAEILSNPVMSQNISSAPQARFFFGFQGQFPLRNRYFMVQKVHFFRACGGPQLTFWQISRNPLVELSENKGGDR